MRTGGQTRAVKLSQIFASFFCIFPGNIYFYRTPAVGSVINNRTVKPFSVFCFDLT